MRFAVLCGRAAKSNKVNTLMLICLDLSLSADVSDCIAHFNSSSESTLSRVYRHSNFDTCIIIII